jgi:hypothetical protein
MRAGERARLRDAAFRKRLKHNFITTAVVLTWPFFGMWFSARLIGRGSAIAASNLTGGKMRAKSLRWKTKPMKI